MSDAVLIAAISAVPGLLVGVIGLIRLFLIDHKVDILHDQVNSKMNTLLEVTGSSREAEGHLKGMAAQKSQDDAKSKE